jgi:glycogen debranching enzyme
MAAMYAAAVTNLLDTNIVAARTDRSPSNSSDPGRYIRAGGGYPDPWTRDAALNCWGAGSILAPAVAGDTLRMVCDVRADGRRIIAQDSQWWDQIIWVIAAWQHCLVTGDRDFVAESYQIGMDSLDILNQRHFRANIGLYAGGSLMQDGISGYPHPLNEPDSTSTFVLDYPASHEIMCLSTNAIYVEAHRALADMAEVLGLDPGPLRTAADRISGAVNEHLWIEETGLYGYFIHGSGDLAGTLDRHQEAAGLALVVAFGIADKRRADRVLSGTHREPYGVVNVWPHFPERFSDEYPGRHNVMCWPMVMGLFGDAAARAGRADVVYETLRSFQLLTQASDNHFFELYNPVTGAVDGGWQLGKHWASEPDQTWSATAFLRLVHTGVVGIRYGTGGITFAPTVPEALGALSLNAFPYRKALLDITVSGSGDRVAAIELDGRDVTAAPVQVAADLTGSHQVQIRLTRDSR